jgi:Fur family ferric uptake transcriptional regulator
MSASEDIKTTGLKATQPRRLILELFRSIRLSDGGCHLSAEDVYQRLHADGQDVALATIYRVLTQFEQAGLLLRHHFESGKAVFELNEGHHHDHLVCVLCGRVEEFYDPEIEKRQEAIAQAHGHRLTGHDMHLYVECNDCARR